MSNRCYACNRSKADGPRSLKDQWLDADLFEKTMSVFFGTIIFGAFWLMLIGLVALSLEVANSY